MTNPPSEQDPQQQPQPYHPQYGQQSPPPYPTSSYARPVGPPQGGQPQGSQPQGSQPQGGYPPAYPQGYPYGYYGQPPQRPARRGSIWRAAAAGAVAGAVLAAAVAIPTTIAVQEHGSDTASTPSAGSGQQQQSPFGSQGGEGLDPFGGSTGQDPFSDGGSTTGQSGTKATSAQQQGVVLVDTTLNGGAGAGTGMVIDSDGLVLTNYHVVQDSTSVKVTIASTGKTYTASVVGRDKSADVAVLKLADASGLDTVKIDSDGVSTKDPVTAVGNASGQGFLSAVTGTVVAQDQHITASEGSGAGDSEALTGLLETDAAVVPGYSGGPLYDAQGEVIGIDTAASTSTSAMGATQNTGQAYAIPIETAVKIAEQIENGDESGSVQIGPSAFLGIGVARQAGTTGASVGEVESGAPAAKAGIVAGDTITKVDGTPVTTYTSLTTALGTHEPGDRVSVTWTTATGKTRTATITLGSSPVN